MLWGPCGAPAGEGSHCKGHAHPRSFHGVPDLGMQAWSGSLGSHKGAMTP